MKFFCRETTSKLVSTVLYYIWLWYNNPRFFNLRSVKSFNPLKTNTKSSNSGLFGPAYPLGDLSSAPPVSLFLCSKHILINDGLSNGSELLYFLHYAIATKVFESKKLSSRNWFTYSRSVSQSVRHSVSQSDYYYALLLTILSEL